MMQLQLTDFLQGNIPKRSHASPPAVRAVAAAVPLRGAASDAAHASRVFGSSGGLVFGRGGDAQGFQRGGDAQGFQPKFAPHATISDFHFGDDGGLLFGKRPEQAALDQSMQKVPKSVKDAITQAKIWAKKEMGGVKDADAEVLESNRILAKMGVKFGSPSMIH